MSALDIFYRFFRNTTVDLSHIDTPAKMSAWPSFHNGVATGLRTSNKAKVSIDIVIFTIKYFW